MVFADLRPVAPAVPPHGSLEAWVVLAVVLAVLIASGMLLTSRR